MSEFENLYIQKDLTFRQRQELSERRRKARMSEADGGESSRSDSGVVVAVSSDMNDLVGRGRDRRSGRGQVSSKIGTSAYGSTLHVARKSLN